MASFDSILSNVFKLVDEGTDDWIDLLKEAVAIKSVSAWPETRDDVIKMVNWFADLLKKEGVSCEIADNGSQTLPDGKVIPLPPILLGTLSSGKCVYISFFYSFH
jgi:nonspecific dipeptidase